MSDAYTSIVIEQRRKEFVTNFKHHAFSQCRSPQTALQLVKIYEQGLDDARGYLIENCADAARAYLVSEYEKRMRYSNSELKNQYNVDAYTRGLDDGRLYVYCKKREE